jgi:hypothetical protein
MTLRELKHSYELVVGDGKYPCGITVQPHIELFIKDKIRSIERGEVCSFGINVYAVMNQEESVRIWYETQPMMNFIKRMEATNETSV